jgi:hypothetical protein
MHSILRERVPNPPTDRKLREYKSQYECGGDKENPCHCCESQPYEPGQA